MIARDEARAASALEADRNRIAARHAELNPGEDALELRPGWIEKSRNAPLWHVERIIAARPPVVDPDWLEMQPGEDVGKYIGRIWDDIPEEAY